MENRLKERNPTTEDLWRAWEEKGKRRDRALFWQMKLFASCVMGALALVVAYYALIAR